MTVWMDEEGPAAAIRFPAHARPTLIMTGAMSASRAGWQSVPRTWPERGETHRDHTQYMSRGRASAVEPWLRSCGDRVNRPSATVARGARTPCWAPHGSRKTASDVPQRLDSSTGHTYLVYRTISLVAGPSRGDWGRGSRGMVVIWDVGAKWVLTFNNSTWHHIVHSLLGWHT